ncbi:triphosphoribosyl-dephospho-CoA synthase [Lactiplantibacillus plantarum]|uniref:triphosphoribosyl-dephospho-CoA synthase n=1 Tax=Lactiplantibacillus plantarum TaxID=1590 RepID=UPI00264A4FBD|nr:triphosphoribosyl-dephospho-CoA synthase [Lactiplantibacillus plantarum]MDN7047786.1 triphosphoribosyl-dephospho-CoA synthase [Lactiplantibacillus plantarum]MDN7066187.1 triphosphoribosyl-dephospho-CoA synthase [Lactiplantibacillus plantarum]MDN7072367.1 triphosphoribosyl-dephospho-CoA synthase [Lactiplantibacillus plantarum]WLT36652.1 triphosphoribosyl-dephospho-CoA synthase [Lactiplantibacillus plantarum]
MKVRIAENLATQAVQALKWEANFAPKPGLVTKVSNGSHTDMDITLFMRSADSLYETFRQIAETAQNMSISLNLREKIGSLGREGEEAMFQATQGVNTHKGAIWALGVLIAVISSQETADLPTILQTAGKLASFPDRYVQTHPQTTYGIQAKRKYKVIGAREEAASGFPHVAAGLKLVLGQAEVTPQQWLRVLCLLYASVDDTNVIHRSSLAVLRDFQNEARQALAAPMVEESPAFQQLNQMAVKYQISPGGCADLFAATYFLHNLNIKEN